MRVSRTREWTIDLPRRGRYQVCRLNEETAKAGRVPRLARLMALAIRFDGLLRSGAIIDQAELARLGKVSRARRWIGSQICLFKSVWNTTSRLGRLVSATALSRWATCFTMPLK
jgi:hypothetical protein